MAETIESFVAKLRQEGVEAGRQEAEKLRAAARREADQVLAQAHTQARKIADDARAQADATLARSKSDLELAARDVALGLREVLSRAIREVLRAGAEKPLTDTDFLSKLLYDIVMQYVQADIGENATIKINVPPEVQQKLTGWALQHLHKRPDMGGASIDLLGTLAEAGFVYQADGANVEVTLSSVVDALSELISPNLRDILQRAMAGQEK
jgi:F0F1-type ATP synthase membrane subunit b/b'